MSALATSRQSIQIAKDRLDRAFLALDAAKKCEHRAAATETRAFSGPVATRDENRAAHGNICIIETCRCGAQKKTNVNGQHSETSGWRFLTLLKNIDAANAALTTKREEVAFAASATKREGIEVVQRDGNMALVRSSAGTKWVNVEDVREAATQPDNGDGIVPLYRGVWDAIESFAERA